VAGLAAIVGWDGRPIEEEGVEWMLDRLPHRATEGRALLSSPGAVLGYARHATTGCERVAAQPLHDSNYGLSIVADVRLDNREELCHLLTASRPLDVSDPELLLRGYERWGEALVERLIGEFAFVIWDSRRRELYAARDPFGIRPLYYHCHAGAWLALASEVEPILALPDMSRAIDDAAVLDYLRQTHRSHRRTFFRAITRLAPGHYLCARAGTVQEARFWRPPARELHRARPAEYEEEFRRLLRRAVAARIDSDRPVVAQLSGGLDSSSLACLADEITRSDGGPPVRLASAAYPGLSCDETPFIDVVARTVSCPSERYDGTAWEPADEERFHIAHPWREAPPGISGGWRRIAMRDGARVVLSGVGGDELLFDDGVFRDLAARGHGRVLLRETALAKQFCFHRSAQVDWLKDAIRGAWPLPPRVRQFYRRLRPRHPVPPPAWVGPRLREIWAAPVPVELEPAACFSHTQAFVWQALTSPLLCRDVDMLAYLAARRGLRLQFPFLDTRLVHFVLAIPGQHRLPGGWTKGLLRRSLADCLPPEIRERRWKSEFSAPIRQTIQCRLPHYASLLSEGHWRSGPYLERRGAQEFVATLAQDTAGAPSWAAWRQAWDFLMLEAWLRDLENVRWTCPPSGGARGRPREIAAGCEPARLVA
jgi:asparagine synthase (glutamine-hydrolysing)